ncbi:MAG: outer membrane protein assembly factor BamD [Ignavibacteria bacterium]|nr:outer membrane protein assembly factor BamD [Ignavibacteria bacterium]
MINIRRAICLLCLIILAVGCKTGEKFEPTNPEEAFNEGLRLFNEREYTESMSYLDMIKLQYPASSVADKAQYYTAEINFARKEYILAAFNYNRTRAVFPGSQFAKIALYKAGFSQYKLSPDYHKDQEYTRRAIKTLQDYQYFYPEKDSLYLKADTMLSELRNKLGEKEYRTAELYTRLESPISALIYYESVIKNYDDTKYFQNAWVGKIQTLYKLKREEEAKNAELTFRNLFPNAKL